MSRLMPKQNGVAANVRAELARHQVTQAAIGKVLELTHTAVSRRLRGVTEFRADELLRIAEHLGVDVSTFYTTEAAS
jgi:transcriptional regulator with XRE-family HTH domain